MDTLITLLGLTLLSAAFRPWSGCSLTRTENRTSKAGVTKRYVRDKSYLVDSVVFYLKMKGCSVLQIRRGKRDNLGIIFHIFSFKLYVATPHWNCLTETVLMRGQS